MFRYRWEELGSVSITNDSQKTSFSVGKHQELLGCSKLNFYSCEEFKNVKKFPFLKLKWGC